MTGHPAVSQAIDGSLATSSDRVRACRELTGECISETICLPLMKQLLADSQRRELYSVWASAKVGSRKPAYLGQLTLVQRCEYFFEMIGAIASCRCNDYSHHVASVFC